MPDAYYRMPALECKLLRRLSAPIEFRGTFLRLFRDSTAAVALRGEILSAAKLIVIAETAPSPYFGDRLDEQRHR